jgi:hypothetical protein
MWNQIVLPLVLAAEGRDRKLRRVAAVCVQHAVQEWVGRWGGRVPESDTRMALDAVDGLRRQADRTELTESPESVAGWFDTSRLAAVLPDPDSEIHSLFGWGCAVDAVLSLAEMFRSDRRLVDVACDTLDLAYQAATREAVQRAMLARRRRAVSESEYAIIEAKVPECRSEAEFQAKVLRAL